MPLPKSLVLIATIIAPIFSPMANAQGISGILNAVNHNDYAGVASQFSLESLTVGGETIYNGSGFLFCTDYEGTSLDQDSSEYPRIENSLTIGTMDDLEVWNRYDNIESRAIAIASARWFVDNYYETSFLSPENNASARQYAFQNVLWEIYADAGSGTGDLDFLSGNFERQKFSPDGRRDSPLLWGYMNDMLDDLRDANVTSDYIPQYEVLVALDERETHQDYLLLAANPELAAVPEPSSSMLILLGSMVILTFRRR